MTDCDSNDAFGNWLAGFADGEGCFLIANTARRSYTPRFVINLREDDRPILEQIQRRLDVGSVARFYPPSLVADGRCPQVTFQVSNLRDCLKLVKVFDRCPLRAKKASDYRIWRQAVLACSSDIRNPERLRELKQHLETQRRFRGDPEPLDEVPPMPTLFEGVSP